jgi:hypothetical protein
MAKSDVILRLVHENIVLRFDAKVQRLRRIEVTNLPALTVSYCGAVFWYGMRLLRVSMCMVIYRRVFIV